MLVLWCRFLSLSGIEIALTKWINVFLQTKCILHIHVVLTDTIFVIMSSFKHIYRLYFISHVFEIFPDHSDIHFFNTA